jgi:phospholipid-binding lipoprotein MlaA
VRPTIAVVAAALLLASCASLPGPEAQPSGPAQAGSNADPFEPLNRRLAGVGRVVRHATPRPVRHGVHNVLQNADEPLVAMNDVLQGRFGAGARTLARFAANTTLGLVGLLDPATKAGLPHHDNGFALTLGRYGVPAGPHLFLPLVGPLTVREAVGGAVDYVTDPVGLARYGGAREVNIARTALSLVDEREPAEPLPDERAVAPCDLR